MAANVYKVDGKRVPGVTTIIGKYGEKGGLIHWAHEQGSLGKTLEEARDRAADAGTAAHEMVDRWIKRHVAYRELEALLHSRGEEETGAAELAYEAMPRPEYVPDEWFAGVPASATIEDRAAMVEIVENAKRGFAAFIEWVDSANVHFENSEMSLVSKTHLYGGTFDGRALVGKSKRRSLLDWKTSNHVYPEYVTQLGGYAILWDEHWPAEPIENVHLLRFSKEFGSFTHYQFGTEVLAVGKEAFLLLRRMHDLYATMKRAVG